MNCLNGISFDGCNKLFCLICDVMLLVSCQISIHAYKLCHGSNSSPESISNHMSIWILVLTHIRFVSCSCYSVQENSRHGLGKNLINDKKTTQDTNYHPYLTASLLIVMAPKRKKIKDHCLYSIASIVIGHSPINTRINCH